MITPDLLQRLCDARRRLGTELEAPPRVRQLAQQAGLSTQHFITQFGAVFGETPLECRARARLDRAREMLLASREPATQIALALGFQNQGSFSRWFARRAGVSPRAYRRGRKACGVPAGCVGLMNLAFALG